jgi:Zn-dependent metalloprotease
LLRFEQTVRGTRVLWSQIDVAVSAGKVGSISATVVPVRSTRLEGGHNVSRSRALRIARRAAGGTEQALSPLRVAYAGQPTSRHRGKPRTPRLAWVVETTPASALDSEASIPLCIVVDAKTGKVIARWQGLAARPDHGPRARGASARIAAGTHAEFLLDVYDGTNAAANRTNPFTGAPAYASFVINGDPHDGRHWPQMLSTPPYNTRCTAPSSPRPCVNYFGATSPSMDAVATNASNVARTICDVRDFCGRLHGPKGDPPLYQPWRVIGNVKRNDSRASASTLTVDLAAGHEMDGTSKCTFGCGIQIPDPRQPANDVIAHEFGHIMDWVFAGDRNISAGDLEANSVQEALGDMFAYDYDRGNATMGENTSGGASRDWQNPGSITRDGQPYPAHMRDYDPSNDPHFNSTILSHAYYLFVQRVGHNVAGNVLQYIPFCLSPKPSFREVRDCYVARGRQLYPSGVNGLNVGDQASASFQAVGL